MEYDKAQDVIITVLEVATSILKEAKKFICKSKEINLLAFFRLPDYQLFKTLRK